MVSDQTAGQSGSAGENQNLNLSEALGRIMDLTTPRHGSGASGDQGKCGTKNRYKEPANLSEMIVRNTKDGNENLFTAKKEKKPPLVVSVKAPEDKVNPGKTRKLRCKICKDQVEFSDKKRLYRHYCYVHYKKELIQLIGGKKEKCPYCDKKFRDSMEVVGHVGCTHKKIEDFLPAHFHIKPESFEKTPVQTQSETAKQSMEYTCGLCDQIKTFNKRSDLYAHYSCFHFRAELIPYIDEAGDQCSLCDLTHKEPTVYKKVRHIGVVHGMVESFLPRYLQLPKLNPNPVQVKTTQRSSTAENATIPAGSPSVSGFQCHICPFSHQRRSKIYGHYAISHYRQHLLARINVVKLDCAICGEIKDDLDSLLTHLGNTHKMVEEFLPPGFHLSRSKNRNSHSSHPVEDRHHGVKKVLDRSESGWENNSKKKRKISRDDPVVKEEEVMNDGSTLRKKMQSIFGELEDSD